MRSSVSAKDTFLLPPHDSVIGPDFVDNLNDDSDCVASPPDVVVPIIEPDEPPPLIPLTLVPPPALPTPPTPRVPLLPLEIPPTTCCAPPSFPFSDEWLLPVLVVLGDVPSTITPPDDADRRTSVIIQLNQDV